MKQGQACNPVFVSSLSFIMLWTKISDDSILKVRGVKARWLHCLLGKVLKSQNKPPISDYVQIERVANDILQSCDEYPSLLTPFDSAQLVVHWVAFYSTMRADVSALSCMRDASGSPT
jgi:hypothetical protein